MQCFLGNISMMRKAAVKTQKKFLSSSVIKELFDNDFIKEVQTEITKLNPICEFIDFVQSRECTLADSVSKWLEIETLLGSYKKWEKRDNMICDLPSLVAYCLHPKYKGHNLSERQLFQVKTWIYRHGEATYSQYELFLKSEKEFGDKYALQFSPEAYWKVMKFQYPELGDIALLYINLPASTASLERIFSMWAFIHNKSRNNLSKTTSEKLIYIYHALKNISSEKLKTLY